MEDTFDSYHKSNLADQRYRLTPLELLSSLSLTSVVNTSMTSLK